MEDALLTRLSLDEFEFALVETPRVFAWLDGAELAEELEPSTLPDGEALWKPPPTFWTTAWEAVWSQCGSLLSTAYLSISVTLGDTG